MSRVEQRFALANHIPVIRPSGQPAAAQYRSRRYWLAKALLAPSLGLGLRPALRASKIVPDDFVRANWCRKTPTKNRPACCWNALLRASLRSGLRPALRASPGAPDARVKTQRTAAPKAKRGRKSA